MRTFSRSMFACLLAAMAVAVMTGCDHNRDNYEYNERYSPVQATPPKPYPLVEDKEKNIKYAVLQQGSLVTSDIDKWKAVNPEFFAKLSGVTVAVPEPDKTMHSGRGYLIPKIEASEKFPDRKLTAISGGYLVPKELNGWVAVSQDTFEKLATEFMTKP